MGSAPAFNISVDVSEDEASELAEEIAEEFGFEAEPGDDISYRYEVPAEMESGRMNASNDAVSMQFLEEPSEYYGTGVGERLVIHYSAYHWEDMSSLSEKLEFLEGIRSFVEGRVSEGSVDYVASSCTI